MNLNRITNGSTGQREKAPAIRDVTVLLRNTEVAHPATEILSQFVQSVLHGDPPASSGVLLDAAFEFLVRLDRPDYAGTAEDKTKKVYAGCSCYRTLGLIDVKLEFVCQEGFHSFHDPITGTLAFDQNDEVVRITQRRKRQQQDSLTIGGKNNEQHSFWIKL
jgi:hypothetical protein